MSKNEILLCLIKTKQNKTVLVSGSTNRGSTALTTQTAPSEPRLLGSRELQWTHETPLELAHLLLRIIKGNRVLKYFRPVRKVWH